MAKWVLGELVNVSALQAMADHLYAISAVPIGIIDSNDNVLVNVGWQDICSKFHRNHPVASERCRISDEYIKKYLHEGHYVEYKCLNNLRDVALPIIVSGEHIATLFVGQFFYEDEVLDIEYFRKQATELGFDEEEYLSALSRIPVFSREKINHIMEYYKGLVTTLVESSMARIKQIEADEKLRKNEVRMRNLLQSMRDTVFVIDEEGTFVECYQSSDMILYATPEVFLGQKYEKILPPEVSILFTNVITRLKEGEVVEPFDYSLKIGDEILWYSAQVSKVKEEGKKTGEIIVVVRDITDKKKYEKELLKAKSEAEAVNNMKNTFIANMSHELRTPINVILSAIQLFELNLKNSLDINSYNSSKHIKAMKQNCHRLLRIINNQIDVTKIEAGFMNLNPRDMNVVSIVEDITLSVAEYAKAKGLYVQFDTEIEEKVMALDPDKLERIILNLLSNAIKFTDKNGNIFVNIYDKETSILISIKDTGIGIPSDKVNKILERFIQVENTLIKSHEGSGIGLSIVKSFVEMHGGTITVLSELGVGSEFLIELPVTTVHKQCNEHCIIPRSTQDYVEMLNIEFSDIYY
ncbi:hypothetical protein CPJCM30710_14690 [Clostridium polyendosporum]|uniref:histidine kinase n=1 Tax=Clostridium polyendosporum TaxID=69208 RepID=A0A919VLP5_9CLOT|nr:PocR ligand-binding domain-containing protein [Clostridium polyendosporum]GIM28803.1 hypothetical protein CPJCM30710_14690 [Clostridium polyendosporum]